MYSFCIPTKFIFGAGALMQLHEEALPGKKALIVMTDGLSLIKHGYLAELEKQLKLAGCKYVLYAGIKPNPTKESIMEAAALTRAKGWDFVIGFGGGSPMDSAKVIALMATNPGDLWDYCQRGTGGRKQPMVPPLPIICITTTAGTGSEADASGMVTNLETHEKLGIGFPELFPTLSVIDPELMTSVPPRLTAYQGLDTFFHLAEGYLSKKANFFNEMFSITGIQNVGQYLARSVKNPQDLEAREHMAFANTLGGFVMSTGKLLSQHSLEHILSAYHPNLPHGAGLILICRAYFQYFIDKNCCPEKFVSLTKALGMSEAKEPRDFMKALENLLTDCEVADLNKNQYE